MVINVTQIAYAIPLVAIAVVVLRLAFRGRRSPTPTPTRRVRALPALVVGAGGLTIAVVLFASADADLRTFRDSPSCRAGLVLASPADGVCGVVSAQIQGSYRSTTKHGYSTHVVLLFPDGSERDVVVAKTDAGDVVRGFQTADDRAATVQQFRGTPVLVQTTSGAFETSGMPARRVDRLGLTGIALGLFGVLAALALTLR